MSAPDRIADRHRRIAVLRNSIELMALRYGHACTDLGVAIAFDNAENEARFNRQRARRDKALRRLTRALADLAEGGTR